MSIPQLRYSPNEFAALVLAGMTIVAACGSNTDNGGSSSVTYRLIEGSQYYYQAGSKPEEVWALTGTMELAPREATAGGLLEYDIVDIALEFGSSGVISGNEGFIGVIEGNPDYVSMRISANIGELSGTGLIGAFSGCPPRFRGMRIEGRRGHAATSRVFRLTIYAEPETSSLECPGALSDEG